MKKHIKTIIRLVFPNRVLRALKVLLVVEATLRYQEEEINRLRGDVNRLLSLVRLNKFGELD